MLLAGILLLAAALRLWHVRQPLIDAFSWRQASTAMMADNFYRTNPNILYPEVSWTGPGPNYQGREFQTLSYLASIGYRIFGQHESIGRAIAAVFGTWGVFALYALVRRVWDEPRALASALTLAIIPGAVFIDRSFLPDPAMLALTTTAMWAFVVALQSGSPWKKVIGAALLSSFAFLTKLPGIVAIAPMVYASVVTLRAMPREQRKPLVGRLLVALVVILIPVAAYYAWAVHLGRTYPPYHVAGSSNWLKASQVQYWFSRSYFLPDVRDDVVNWFWTAPVIALVVLGLVIAPPRESRLRWFFHAWLFGCCVLFVVGARELAENPWNLHVFNLFAAVMGGHALVSIASIAASTRNAALLRVAIVAAIVGTYGQVRLLSMYSPHAMNSYLLGLELRKRSAPGDLVVTMADDVGDPIAVYYSRRRGWVFPPAHDEKHRSWNIIPRDPKKSIAMVEDLRDRGAKWFGFVASPRDDTPGRKNFWSDHPQVTEHINKTCEFVMKDKHVVIYRFLTRAELAEKQAESKGSREARGS